MDETIRAALERNDRFLRSFVEALSICPFAQRTRETGRLERRVILGQGLDESETFREIEHLLTPAFAQTEVGLLIFPEVRADPTEFERFATRLRERLSQASGTDQFFVVPFHPALPADVSTPARAVNLMRRSPDPTLQLVRKSVLERARGAHSGETRWMDPAALGKPLPPAPPPSMSERITQENFETIGRVGLAQIVALLASMRA